MKVSKKPSDYFPSAVKKMLKGSDYADAAAKLRGVAGELVFELEGIELPGGLKIVGRQVDAAGKVIDFALQDASGRRALLEVKAWNTRRWAKEIAANARKKKLSGAFRRLIDQLNASKSTGQPVYLAVSDAIGTNMSRLLELLEARGLDDVKVLTFPEAKLREVSGRLRVGLALSGGAALVTANQVTEEEVDD